MDMPKDPASKSSRKRKPVQYRSRHKRLDHLGEEVTKHGFKERLTVAGPTKVQSSERVFCGVWGINQAETEISEMEINNGNYRVALNHLEDRVRDRRPPRKSTPSTRNMTSQHEPDGSHFSYPSQSSTSITSMPCQPRSSTNPPQFGYSPEQGLPIEFPSVHFYRPTATENVVVPQLPLPSQHFQGYNSSVAPTPNQLGAYWYPTGYYTMTTVESRDPTNLRQTQPISQPPFCSPNSSMLPLENYSYNQTMPPGLEGNIHPRPIDRRAQQYRSEHAIFYDGQPNDNMWNVNVQPPDNSYTDLQNVNPIPNAHSGNLDGYIPSPENEVLLGFDQYGGPFYQNISRTQ